MRLGGYLKLARLTRRRFASLGDCFAFQRQQATLVVDSLAKKVDLQGKKVLDLGCGLGGYSLLLAEAGGKVTALDLGSWFMAPGNPGLCFLRGDALRLPFVATAFDLVFCASLIEHVPQPEALLAEIHRVLLPEGLCYLSFPPFYSPVGGHQFKPYHLLGERAALALTHSLAKSYAQAYGDWGLYPLTIRKAKTLIRQTGFTIREIATRFSPLNFALLPWLGEFLTWHVGFILKKEQGA